MLALLPQNDTPVSTQPQARVYQRSSTMGLEKDAEKRRFFFAQINEFCAARNIVDHQYRLRCMGTVVSNNLMHTRQG